MHRRGTSPATTQEKEGDLMQKLDFPLLFLLPDKPTDQYWEI